MMNEQFPQQQTPLITPEEKSKPNWMIWIAAGGCVVLLCAVFFVGALIFVGPQIVKQFAPTSTPNPVQVATEIPRETVQSNTMGKPDAPVHIIEYSDFQCPYCRMFWSDTEPQLIEEYVNTGKVYFEYRSLGEFIGQESAWAAEGAYCAGDQGKFWEFHDMLFTNQTGENVGDFSKENLIRYAEALGMNTQDFESCINSEKYKAKVEQDAKQAGADGVNATPTFLINGVKMEGAQPFSILKELIEKALTQNPAG